MSSTTIHQQVNAVLSSDCDAALLLLSSNQSQRSRPKAKAHFRLVRSFDEVQLHVSCTIHIQPETRPCTSTITASLSFTIDNTIHKQSPAQSLHLYKYLLPPLISSSSIPQPHSRLSASKLNTLQPSRTTSDSTSFQSSIHRNTTSSATICFQVEHSTTISNNFRFHFFPLSIHRNTSATICFPVEHSTTISNKFRFHFFPVKHTSRHISISDHLLPS
ncbi:hypothetical protein AC578_8169 [Pseudocercospora eumusae]|uniref:Uncharacterized protein n=1 Tax=Pseudocercospora eumusae TaxID=321146 RepID=A0A139HAP5_9PEZI|nr:hypothetical protein AC578_8169 [Pseudocercospora eumusae]